MRSSLSPWGLDVGIKGAGEDLYLLLPLPLRLLLWLTMLAAAVFVCAEAPLTSALCLPALLMCCCWYCCFAVLFMSLLLPVTHPYALLFYKSLRMHIANPATSMPISLHLNYVNSAGFAEPLCMVNSHLRSLQFADKPDYAYLKQCLAQLYQQQQQVVVPTLSSPAWIPDVLVGGAAGVGDPAAIANGGGGGPLGLTGTVATAVAVSAPAAAAYGHHEQQQWQYQHAMGTAPAATAAGDPWAAGVAEAGVVNGARGYEGREVAYDVHEQQEVIDEGGVNHLHQQQQLEQVAWLQQQHQQRHRQGHHALAMNTGTSQGSIEVGDTSQPLHHQAHALLSHAQQPQQQQQQQADGQLLQPQLLPQLQPPPLPLAAQEQLQWLHHTTAELPGAAAAAAAAGLEPVQAGAAAAAASMATAATAMGRMGEGEHNIKRGRDAGGLYLDPVGVTAAAAGGPVVPVGLPVLAAESAGPRPMKRYRWVGLSRCGWVRLSRCGWVGLSRCAHAYTIIQVVQLHGDRLRLVVALGGLSS